MEGLSPVLDTSEKIFYHIDISEMRANTHETYETLSDSLSTSMNNLKESDNSSGDGDDDAPRKRIMKRVKRFSDSDSDSGREKTLNCDISGSGENSPVNKKSIIESDDSEYDLSISKSVHKSRIQKNLSDSEESGSDNAVKNGEQQLRMKNKRNKLRDKFKALVTARGKELSPTNIEDEVNRKSNSSSDSGEEMAAIEKINQKIKERMSFKPSICDPDTSDEEISQKKPVYKQKKERKMTKPTSPKPQRMSAKQAMENMQKIKSESNRMLREKEVSLPYHRPKALSLKDIMSRRRAALSSDGKALPIKMNEDQLKQYAQMLEERQKEMMELCKSESDEEENNENSEDKKDTDAVIEDGGKETKNDIIDSTETENTGVVSTEPMEKSLTEAVVPTITNTDHMDNIINEVDKEQSCTDSPEEDVNKSKEEDDVNEVTKDQDSETSMQLVYNDSANSIVDDNIITEKEAISLDMETEIENNVAHTETMEDGMYDKCNNTEKYKADISEINTEADSQLISLRLDTENTDYIAQEANHESNLNDNDTLDNLGNNSSNQSQENVQNERMEVENEFSDDEINMADIDNIIENAEIIKDIEDKVNSQFLVRDKPLNMNPKLGGAPGMVIDLEGTDSVPRKSGIELLKERYTFFAKLKTPEEKEREREKRVKPGFQLKRLKEELEEKIAEQRSIEWAKRLENEKLQQKELKEIRGEESEEDDLDKIEAAIEGKEEIQESEKSESEGEEEPIEDDIVIKDKPRERNAMLDDEAEESDCEDEDQPDDTKHNDDNEETNGDNKDDDNDDEIDEDINNDDDEQNESDSDESDESSEEEEQTSTKKGRILKAFEDSDDEADAISEAAVVKEVQGTTEAKSGCSVENFVQSQIFSQDEELQLAQRHKSCSEDLFTSQESTLLASEVKAKTKHVSESDDAFTQTFSITDTSKQPAAIDFDNPDKEAVVSDTQDLEMNKLDDLCPITESQMNLPLPSQIPIAQGSQSQTIGEDVLALCTGQFYDNQFVSQMDDQDNQIPLGDSQKYDTFDSLPSQDSQEENNSGAALPNITVQIDKETNSELKHTNNFIEFNIDKSEENNGKAVDDNLKSILDELADPEFDSPKPNKFFVGNKNTQKGQIETQVKKRFVIDSDEETNEVESETKKRKKLKKKKPEKRALQISDDEEELSEQEEIEETESELEDDNPDRLVEYDSEENEIEIKPQNQNPKKKTRKMAEFFENEAELTSEDEWAGSGDEDEAGLDRMEREEGDDDTFHQGALQQELGLIHMRDVLDQDKREVRLIQELLFEDGDLGGGGRQRKFRWKNLDGDEEAGTVPDEFADTQQEEFESEEQWRKQRHERETFLRQMHNKDEPEGLNVSVNRTTIIKANLLSKTMSSLLEGDTTTDNENPPVEKKTAKDIPSPKKPFALLQQPYQGSLLCRGRGALARLAALATPLAADDDASVGTLGPTSRRNFVFAAITPDDKPKVTKRKAEPNPNTPKLVKKMRTEEKQNTSKNSLLDHFKL